MKKIAFTLKTVTPLHIGGAESAILPMSFLAHEGWIHVVSEDKLAELLSEKNLLDPFVKEALDQRGKFQLYLFLEKRGLLNNSTLDRITSYRCRFQGQISKEFRPFIRNGFGQPFIPGSSIKGAWRTAILYCLLKKLPKDERENVLDKTVRKALEEVKKNPRAKWSTRQNLFKNEEERLMRSFLLGKKQNDIHTDFLRVIKVHDSAPLDRDTLSIREVRIYSAQSAENPKRFPLYAETIEPGVSVKMEYSIDEQLLENFRAQNRNQPIANGAIHYDTFEKLVLDPIGCVKKMANDVLAHERAFFENELDCTLFFQNEPNFHLGWGGSLIVESLAHLLPEELRQQMRNLLFTDRGNAPAPKSRKVIAGEKPMLLGWCQLSVESELGG